MSKESYKEKVKKAVKNVAFEELKAECRSKGKTEKIKYTVFTTQKYLLTLPVDVLGRTSGNNSSPNVVVLHTCSDLLCAPTSRVFL